MVLKSFIRRSLQRNILLYALEEKNVHLAFFLPMKGFLNCYVIKHFKGLESQKFDHFLLKNKIHFKKHFIDVEGHYDSDPILTINFVDDYQSQGHILLKKSHSHGRLLRYLKRDCVRFYYSFAFIF